MGDFAKAASLYERAAAIDPDDYQALVFASQCYRSLGQEERGSDAARRALAVAERAVAHDPTDALNACALEPDEPHCRYNAACAYVLLGEHERALDMLETLDLKNMANRAWMQHDVEFDPLREHPRFKAIMAATR